MSVTAGEERWLGAWAVDSELQLYGPDGSHPSALGTYQAALVVYEGITGHDARALPADGAARKLGVPTSQVRLQQRAAHEAVARFAAE